MPSTSGWARSESGLLLMIMAALPLIRVMDILWNNCLMAMFSSIPWCRDKAAPILFVCSTATLWKPPSVSTAKGRKEIPCSWQAWAAPSTFRLKAFSRAPPASAAADDTFDWARGPVTVTSMAVASMEKIVKSKLLDFTRFLTKYYYFWFALVWKCIYLTRKMIFAN